MRKSRRSRDAMDLDEEGRRDGRKRAANGR